MEERIYDYWVASLQDGYIGNLIDIADAFGGAKSFHEYAGCKRAGGGLNLLLQGAGSNGKSWDSNKNIMLTKRLENHILKNWKNADEIARDYSKMIDDNVRYVNHTDGDFPARLLNIPSPPYGLFLRGSLPSDNVRSIAIVGARESSEYGRVCAEYFGDRLAREGVQVISGMAWGIDGIGQTAAVMAGGKSYGVLGCGVDVVYPKNNWRLYEMLCKNGNGVLSEYAPGTAAIARGFPPRNRIIAGLCDVLLVIEAKAKSGTLITVNMAIDQGKTIMALPGRITDELSRGCLNLIEEGAVAALSVESVLRELETCAVDRNSRNEPPINCGRKKEKLLKGLSDDEHDRDITGEISKKTIRNLPDDEKKIMGYLSYDPVSVEELSQNANLPIKEVLVILSKLELKGAVKELSIGKFVAEV